MDVAEQEGTPHITYMCGGLLLFSHIQHEKSFGDGNVEVWIMEHVSLKVAIHNR